MMCNMGIACRCQGTAGHWESNLCLSKFGESLLMAPRGRIWQAKPNYATQGSWTTFDSVWHPSCDLSRCWRESRLSAFQCCILLYVPTHGELPHRPAKNGRAVVFRHTCKLSMLKYAQKSMRCLYLFVVTPMHIIQSCHDSSDAKMSHSSEAKYSYIVCHQCHVNRHLKMIISPENLWLIMYTSNNGTQNVGSMTKAPFRLWRNNVGACRDVFESISQ